ncbi:MAG: SpoVA/SpoVAEb family sporulation membrane protein [Oscillospiraceae bacterium]|nr:SpoVA/SpoVAEb family sporulation membrane protein [Oscillospiraceae bacterium]
MAEKKSPGTKGYTLAAAFLFGGAICVLGQFLQNLYMNSGLDKKTASTTVAITLIAISAVLTGLNIYDKFSKVAGAGALVPITGFANAVAAPAMEYKTEGYIMGIGAKLFTIAGPVIVYGVAASAIYGLILYLMKTR